MINQSGENFLRKIRNIITEASKENTSERAARHVAFALLVMLDGSNEGDSNYILLDPALDFDRVKFNHHDL